MTEVSNKICGIVNVDGEMRNMLVYNVLMNADKKSVYELIYANEFSDVESLIGFADLTVQEVESNDPVVESAMTALGSDPNAKAIIFINDGFLIVTDLTFFTAYVKVGDSATPYLTAVESSTYEEEDAEAIISEFARLV